MGFLLFIIAIILFIPLTIINLIIVLRKDFSIDNLNRFFYETALDLDRFGNRNFRTLFNLLLITPVSNHEFGDFRETVSSVLGKNQIKGTLTKLGWSLVRLLDFFDEDHCLNAIRYYD